ncbi:MAG: HAMP domain-containing histidine kinase, partial [Solobacterium sp.]|nr:HAMP domain-containing histidine kinase [Solobacterium sp.]
MKRFTMWLRELSLVQQLLLIIFSFLIILAVFILLFLSRSIDRFSETEMYRILHNSQETIVTYMNNHEGEVPLFHYSSDASITDAVYDVNNDELYILSGKSISPQLMQDIKRNSAMQNAVTQDYKMVPIEGQEGGKAALSILYSMTKTENGAMVVSVMEDDYRMQFRQSLVSGVVFANILFVSILFALLMLWVSSLIIPLSQIKSYITKIKNEDKSATLNIRRHDEIGEVANALIDMESQLDKQSKDKEEMIQNISHDLKTPIATIKSYGEAIKDGIYPYETLEKSVDVIIEHADRLEKKVKSLIMLNKMGYLLDTKEDGENLLMNEIVEKVILSVKAI